MKKTQGHTITTSEGVVTTTSSSGARKILRKRHLYPGTVALGAASLILVATAVPVAAILNSATTTTSPVAVPVSTTIPVPTRVPVVTARARIASAHERNVVRAAHLLAAERARVTTHTPSAPTTSTTGAPQHEASAHAVASVARATAGPVTSTTLPKPAAPKPAAVSRATTPATVVVTPKPVKKPRPAVTRAGGPSSAARELMAHLNPGANIAPSPNFLSSGSCSNIGGAWSCQNPCITASMTWPTFTNAPACTNYVLSAINNARAVEGLAAMTLPSNWFSLSTGQQLFVVTNLERTARGLPAYLGINPALSSTAQRAAGANTDPGLSPGFAVGNATGGQPAWGAAWSGGFSVLAADYIWMYDDGWAGSRAATSNIACTSPSASGCWGHRDELLGYDPGYNPGVGLDATNVEVGVGFSVVGSSGSFVVLVELAKAAPPAMTFTWANDVVPYL